MLRAIDGSSVALSCAARILEHSVTQPSLGDNRSKRLRQLTAEMLSSSRAGPGPGAGTRTGVVKPVTRAMARRPPTLRRTDGHRNNKHGQVRQRRASCRSPITAASAHLSHKFVHPRCFNPLSDRNSISRSAHSPLRFLLSYLPVVCKTRAYSE